MENLRQEVENLKQENAELRAALKTANKRIQELIAQLSQNSSNSNWPPSRDKSRKKRTKSLRRKSDKKAGGQKGHPGHTLEFSETPDYVEKHRPTDCQHCHTPFSAKQTPVAIDKRQVFDIPPLELIIHEHRAETLVCEHCGHHTPGLFPNDVLQPVQYGTRLQQLAVYLKVEQFIPYKRSRQLLKDLFGANISLGTLQNIITRAARQLTPVVETIKSGLRLADVLHVDESGFYIGGKRHWLHTAGTDTLTCYFPHAKRGGIAIDAMDILPHFQGTAVHDGWAAYRRYKQCRHSLCNAHHLRELTAVWENDGQKWAQRFKFLLLSAKRAVEQAKLDDLSKLPDHKIKQIERIYTKIIALALNANLPPPEGWSRGTRGRVKKTKSRNLAERLDNYRPAVLAFVYDFKVPFDNNLAERDIRMIKVQQKISGCFRSQSGAEAFCTIRSYIATIRKQELGVWDALGSVFSSNIILPKTTPV
jgi:transposase